MGSVSSEGNVSDTINRGTGGSNRLDGFEFNNKNGIREQQKGQRREEEKPKESKSPIYDSMFDSYASNGGVAREVRPSMEVSSGHGYEVGDMVWGKVKSHPWWPGHVYSEEFATPSVRRSKIDGLLLVAFFGDSSYGWFDHAELIPFDSNFAEKSLQTNSRTFVKAVEEAIEEVSRRRSLGLCCMCRNKKNFRQTGVQCFFSVDVVEYDPGAVYSIDAIGKARDNFQPSLSLDFVRQLALEPTGSDHADIDFIKNKATVMSYRRAVYEEFDETYAQAFGYGPVHPSSGSIQESTPGKTPTKAPLSGREVFADTLGKGRNPAKLNKPKDHAKKDKYLFKRRDESKEIKMHQKEKRKVTSSPRPAHFDDPSIAAGDYKLQKRFSGRDEQIGINIANGELALRDATGTGASKEDKPIILEFDNPGFEMKTSKVESPSNSSIAEVAADNSGHLPKLRRSVDDEKRIMPELEDRKTSSGLVVDKSSSEAKVFSHDDIPSSRPHKLVSQQKVVSEPKMVKVFKRPAGELGSGRSVLPEKKKKRKNESLMSDSTHIHGQEAVSLAEKVLANKPLQSALAPKHPIEGPHRTGLGNYEVGLPQVLGDLHSLALDPFRTANRGLRIKVRQVFLRFRSLVFQKSLNSSLAEGEANGIHFRKPPALISATGGSENGIGVPPVKPQARFSGRPDDPTKGGHKRGPSDRLEEMAAKRKKKIGEIRNLTKETKVTKKIEEPSARVDGRQAAVITPRKLGAELSKKTEQRAPEPTMLLMKFPTGGSLPSVNELKARFARYGPMDHSGTRVFWNTFSCRVVYRHKIHAEAAYKFVVGSGSLFGNVGVKCCLKEVEVVGSGDPEPPLKVRKEDPSSGAHQPSMEDKPLQLKSCLKKSGGEEGGGRGAARVKFMLGGDEIHKDKNGDGSSSFSSSSDTTMDFNSKNFQKAVVQPSQPPLHTCITVSSGMHYSTSLAPPSLPLPPLPQPPHYGGNMGAPPLKKDVAVQMIRLMTKCNDVVSNVTGLLGYVPYHPL
ncbi:hypothetical protein L6452_01827 [Arctium lappa]|uniref:Uncharacterized protein n=1 Tax=Arctium lappa TaxID=4217 RepID=A0ACB9FIM2_ARCLA|nr:hypothetical protein L6452_01827 [Arctium lappa]